MKRLLTLFLLLCSAGASAQLTGPTGYGIQQNFIKSLKGLWPPLVADTTVAKAPGYFNENATNGVKEGMLIRYAADFKLYELVKDGTDYYFKPVGGSSLDNTKWSKTGDIITSGQFIGSTNNAEFQIKANNDTVIRVLPSGQVAITPKITTGITALFLQNKAAPNGLLTNTMFSMFKSSLGGATNAHLAGMLLFPGNEWANISQGPVWYYGFAPNEKAGYLTFGARDQLTNVFPYLTVNKNYWLGVGRTGTMTSIDATAIMHIAPGLDSVAPLKFTTGSLLSAPQKGAFEYASNALWFTRDAGRNKFLFDGYTDTITVSAAGGDYTTLSALFASESAGDKLILLPDSLYQELNPQYIIKEGWHMKGRGMGRTVIRFNFNRAIVANSDGFQLKANCKLEDVQVVSVNNASGTNNYYALHSDQGIEFKAQVIRCHLKTVKEIPGSTDASGGNGIVVGIGTWEGQVIEFIDCILEGQTVATEKRNVINSHNSLATSGHLKPSRLTFKNCLITGGFNAVFINDTYTGTEPDSARTKDLWEFLGCTIQGGINFRSQGAKKNGFAFNFAGTTVDEMRNADSIVNTGLSNYDASSLPLPSTVEYWKNVGATNIVAGDLVAYVYANRDPYWNYSTPINIPIGIEKIPSGSTANFAGIALTNSDAGRFAHVAVGGVAYHNVAYAGINVGQNVTMSSVGALAVANGVGIGRVERKTSTNMLGLRLNPQGVKGNNTSAVSGFTSRLLVGSAVDDGVTPLQVGGQSSFSSNAFMTAGGLWFNAVGAFNLGVYQSGGTDLRLRTGGSDRISIDAVGEITFNRAIATPILTVTGNTTLTEAHSTVLVNNAGSVTITLPTASGVSGRAYTIKKLSAAANDVIISGASVTLTIQGSAVTVQSDGTTYHIIGSHVGAAIL
jgi:hypothetical protein